MRVRIVLAWVLVASVVGGCGGGGDDDAATSADDYANLPTTINNGVVYTNTRDSPMAADFVTCRTEPQAVSNVASVTFTGKLLDFQNKTVVTGATLDVWIDVTSLASPPAATTTTDSSGNYSITVNGLTNKPARLHWRSFKAGETFATFELNNPFDPGMATQTEDRNSVSVFTGDALPALAGIRRAAGTGVIAGSLRDCARKEVGNATATVIGTDGKVVPGVKVVYMSDQDLPRRRDPEATPHSIMTNARNGVFIIIDVPPTTGTLKMEAHGRLAAGEEPTVLSEFSAPVFADSVVIVDADPKRTP